jgi:hypothetical protein
MRKCSGEAAASARRKLGQRAEGGAARGYPRNFAENPVYPLPPSTTSGQQAGWRFAVVSRSAPEVYAGATTWSLRPFRPVILGSKPETSDRGPRPTLISFSG